MSSVILEQILEVKPFSANKMHYRDFKRDTMEYRRFKKQVAKLVEEHKKTKTKDKLKVTIVFAFSSSLSDLDNGFKPLLDSLQLHMGFDDKQVFVINAGKLLVPKKQEFILLRIERITEREYKRSILKMFPKFKEKFNE